MHAFPALHKAHTALLDVVDILIEERKNQHYSPMSPSLYEQKNTWSDAIDQFRIVLQAYPMAPCFTPTIDWRIYEIWLLGKLIMREGDVDSCRNQISLQLNLMVEAVLDVR